MIARVWLRIPPPQFLLQADQGDHTPQLQSTGMSSGQVSTAQAFISTVNLDGETNLKERRAVELASAEAEHTVRISYLEIYNEQIYDLLEIGRAHV